MNNEELLTQFYRSFQNGDSAGMADCYDASVNFTDPAFGLLEGKEVPAMWAMLLSRKESELSIEFFDISANESSGQARWIARYKFGPHKRAVVNNIHSKFKFHNGKIIEQKDDFDLWAWSRQALGLTGYLLGWTSFLRKKIRKMARKSLKSYINEKG